MGWLSTKITKTLHPDAHDTSANMGASLGQEGGTYYDKATGRWVFGGDGDAGGPPVVPPPLEPVLPLEPLDPLEPVLPGAGPPTGAGPLGQVQRREGRKCPV